MSEYQFENEFNSLSRGLTGEAFEKCSILPAQ